MVSLRGYIQGPQYGLRDGVRAMIALHESVLPSSLQTAQTVVPMLAEVVLITRTDGLTNAEAAAW